MFVTGLIVVALAEEAPKSAVSPSSTSATTPEKTDAAAEVTKRDSDKGNVLIHGSPPHNYVLQPADSQQQVTDSNYYGLISKHCNSVHVAKINTGEQNHNFSICYNDRSSNNGC